ncbi:hypothetical protein E2C01_065869 [Portunus trituberculatus]|uniref:Uncharacterized protein n=1 Tax=Portunus trituberculatus TaxID=210409 RepID=A0A5B7HPG9_PORTR|nr:hypothetical protein [Portunus trituberculatus]
MVFFFSPSQHSRQHHHDNATLQGISGCNTTVLDTSKLNTRVLSHQDATAATTAAASSAPGSSESYFGAFSLMANWLCSHVLECPQVFPGSTAEMTNTTSNTTSPGLYSDTTPSQHNTTPHRFTATHSLSTQHNTAHSPS